jgi:hypothetical protein
MDSGATYGRSLHSRGSDGSVQLDTILVIVQKTAVIMEDQTYKEESWKTRLR